MSAMTETRPLSVAVRDGRAFASALPFRPGSFRFPSRHPLPKPAGRFPFEQITRQD
jgi:hypothetical protein